MKMTIRKKLYAGFWGVLLILAVTVGISYSQIKAVDQTYRDLIDDKAAKLIMIENLDTLIKKEQVGVRDYMIIGDEQALAEYKEAHESYLKESKKLSKLLVQPKAKELLKELDEFENQHNHFAEVAFQLRDERRTSQYTNLIATRGREIVFDFDKKIDELTAYQEKLLDQGKIETTEKVESIVNIVVVLGIVAFLIGMVIATYISRIISKPVVAIARAAEKISAGDLTVEEITVKNKDEIGELAHSFNQMSHNLREIIQQVGSNAEQVASSAEQLSASAEQSNFATKRIAETMEGVASGVDKQVQSIDETSQTITEMSNGVQQIAHNAQSASATAFEATEKATNGGQSIQTAVQQMNSINQTVQGLADVVKGLGTRSGEIGEILEVITGIAAQTNLLALNAAIEAARAGEHGRGFAVVADEVRRLAEQSASSAQQISELIGSIQEETRKAIQSMELATNEVQSGIGVVNIAGESFVQIENSVNEVTNQIQEVSSAVQQMAAGTEQIVHSVKAISEAAEEASSGAQEVSASTEEQLASIEEISHSSGALEKMAEDLQKVIGRFKI